MHTEKVNGMNGRSRAYGFLCSVLRQENSTFLFGLIATVLLTFFVLCKGLHRRNKESSKVRTWHFLKSFLFFLPWCKWVIRRITKKKSSADGGPPAGQANAHEQSIQVVNTFCLRSESLKLLLRVYLQLMEALSFSFVFFKDVSALW